MQPYSSWSEGGTEQSSCWKTSAKSTFLLRPTITRRAKTASRSYTVFPLIFTPRFRTCIVLTVFFIGWWKPPGRDDAKLVRMSCPIATASCTLTSVSETTCPFTMLYSESDGCVSGCECFRSSVKIRSLSSRSSSRLCCLLPCASHLLSQMQVVRSNCTCRPSPLQGKNKRRSTRSRRRLVQGWSIYPSVPRLDFLV